MSRKLARILELDKTSVIEAKFVAFMNQFSPQSKKAPTIGEMAYLHTKAPLSDQVFQVEDASFVNNRGYVFGPNNNLPTHYNQGPRHHENLSNGN